MWVCVQCCEYLHRSLSEYMAFIMGLGCMYLRRYCMEKINRGRWGILGSKRSALLTTLHKLPEPTFRYKTRMIPCRGYWKKSVNFTSSILIPTPIPVPFSNSSGAHKATEQVFTKQLLLCKTSRLDTAGDRTDYTCCPQSLQS